MPQDFLPTNDAELQGWLINSLAVLNANPAAVGFAPADVTPLSAAKTAFDNAVADQISKQEAAIGAIATKKTRHRTVQQILRPLVRRIQSHHATTDGVRGQLSIAIPDRVLTRRGVCTEVPSVVLETKPEQVVVHFGTNPGNEQNDGKPDWASGTNTYRKKGGGAAFVQIAFDTASPYIGIVTGAAVNISYRAVYRGGRDTDSGGFSAEQTVAAGR